MYFLPLYLAWLFHWLLVGLPRGLYHLWNPAAYDQWKIREEFRKAWPVHRRACEQCRLAANTKDEAVVLEHAQMVLREIEALLLASSVVRRGLARLPDEVTRGGRALVVFDPSSEPSGGEAGDVGAGFAWKPARIWEFGSWGKGVRLVGYLAAVVGATLGAASLIAYLLER